MRRTALGLIAISVLILIVVGVLLVTQSGDDTGDLEELSIDALVEDIENREVILVTSRGEHLEVAYDANEDPTHFVDTGEEVSNLPDYLEEHGVSPPALAGLAFAYEDTSATSESLETYGLAIGGIAASLLIIGIIVFIRSDEGSTMQG
ncbi:MAG: hypothetical protein L0154_18565 [Chloroflexi bacterium]|nr:hypothetical protein [Chloroflexota bacterium]